jgi:ferritin-like metal-binding protein YciE
MTIASTKDIFFDQMKDLYSATGQVAGTLPDLRNRATEERLAELLQKQADVTRRHVEEIMAIFEAHGVEAGNDVCKAIEGLIDGGNQHLDMAADARVRDLLLIAHCSRIAHYLIAASDFTRGIAEMCDLSLEAGTLADVLAAKSDFAKDLSELASSIFGVRIGGDS